MRVRAETIKNLKMLAELDDDISCMDIAKATGIPIGSVTMLVRRYANNHLLARTDKYLYLDHGGNRGDTSRILVAHYRLTPHARDILARQKTKHKPALTSVRVSRIPTSVFDLGRM